MTILENTLWGNDRTPYNIYDSNIDVVGEYVRYPLQLALIDNCSIRSQFNLVHRGFHGSAITNSNIFVKGKNANESNCICLLRDMYYLDDTNTKHF